MQVPLASDRASLDRLHRRDVINGQENLIFMVVVAVVAIIIVVVALAVDAVVFVVVAFFFEFLVLLWL